MRRKIKQIIENFKYKDGEDKKEWYSLTVSALCIVFSLFIILLLIVKLILRVVI